MPGVVTFRVADYSDEKSSVSFETDDITNANLDAVEALNGALQTAIEGVIAGNVNTRSLKASVAVGTPGPAATAAAQRELKWRLELSDSVTGERIFRDIPCADVATDALFVANSDEADMSHAAWVSLKGAIDGNYNNPKTGNSLLLISARVVGRNL